MFSISKSDGKSKSDDFQPNVWQKIAHDLRSPISVLQGYLEFKSQDEMTSDEAQYLEAVRKSVEKLIRIADEIAASEVLSEKNEGSILSEAKFQNDRKNVLIVDDDEGIRLQWKFLLDRQGYHAIQAASGEELLGMKIDFSQIHSAIVDFHFVGSHLNGLDVLEFLKRKNIERVHLCTNDYQNEGLCAKAKTLGVTSILKKPISSDFDVS